MNAERIDRRPYFSTGWVADHFIWVLIVLFVGCASATGTLERNADVTQQFQNYQISTDYRYYYVGPQGRPDAVMGVYREFDLASDLWTEIDLTQKQLKKWVDGMDARYGSRTNRYPYGYAITGPEGEAVGIWYSIYSWTTVIVEEGKRVRIYPPATEDPMELDRRMPGRMTD